SSSLPLGGGEVGRGGQLSAAIGGGDLVQRKLRRAIHVQEAVRFLIGIRELRVAEAREEGMIADDLQEPPVAIRELLRASGARIAQCRAFVGGKGDATELGEEHRAVDVRMLRERDEPPGGKATIPERVELLTPIALAETVGIGVVVVEREQICL